MCLHTSISSLSEQCMRTLGAAGTTAGQDLNLSLERITANRNLTNKLWNAGKFIALQLEGVPDAELAALAGADYSRPGALAGLPLAERWVLSELHQVRDGVRARVGALAGADYSRVGAPRPAARGALNAVGAAPGA